MMADAMSVFFDVTVHGLIVAGIIFCFYMLFSSVSTPQTSIEKLIRVVALMTALLCHFAAKALGISLAEMIGRSLMISMPLTFGLIGVLVPAALGVFLAWFIVHTARRDEFIAVRVLILIGTFIIVQFGDAYLASVTKEGMELGKRFVPNITFTIAVGLYMVLRYVPQRRP